jgi:NADH-quinone oxidoreductase subunit H
MLTKEIIKMRQSDRLLHDLAPYFVLVASFLTFACLPWHEGVQILDFNIGVFFFIAVSGIGVVGILLAGWASRSKYPIIGAMRSGAQLVSYELSIGMTMLTMIILCGTMQLSEIVNQQAELGWNIFRGHIPAVLAFLIYMVAGNAECNRGPFDLPEAESELTAGYHTEYSGMGFGFFYLAEYLNLFICAAMAATIFFGSMVFPYYVAVLMGIVVRILITGALHEDGLCDFLDGFGGGGNDRARILAIMKDSHIGTYGVLGLIIYFLLLGLYKLIGKK